MEFVKKTPPGRAVFVVDIDFNLMVGHLKSHPEDMELVTAAFEERLIPMDVLAMQSQKQ